MNHSPLKDLPARWEYFLCRVIFAQKCSISKANNHDQIDDWRESKGESELRTRVGGAQEHTGLANKEPNHHNHHLQSVWKQRGPQIQNGRNKRREWARKCDFNTSWVIKFFDIWRLATVFFLWKCWVLPVVVVLWQMSQAEMMVIWAFVALFDEIY